MSRTPSTPPSRVGNGVGRTETWPWVVPGRTPKVRRAQESAGGRVGGHILWPEFARHTNQGCVPISAISLGPKWLQEGLREATAATGVGVVRCR